MANLTNKKKQELIDIILRKDSVEDNLRSKIVELEGSNNDLTNKHTEMFVSTNKEIKKWKRWTFFLMGTTILFGVLAVLFAL